MKITGITTGEIYADLKKPFKTALRTVTRIEDILVKIETDNGVVGYGEAPPTAVITGDTKDSILCAIRDYIAPSILGMDTEDFDEIMHRMHQSIHGNTSAKAAVDMALYDICSKTGQQPLYRFLGGQKNQIITDITISVNDTEQMIKDAAEAVQSGFHILKIKVGKNGFADADKIAAIRQAVGNSVKIRVDANQGWDKDTAIKVITKMEDMGLDIELVEQPVPYYDFDGLKYISDTVDTNILADESVFSIYDARRIIDAHAADLINIKLMKTGGIYNALKICSLAEQAGIQCMIGCMLESKLAVSAAAHLAAAKNVITMADLDGPSLCRNDPYIGGPVFKGEKIILTEDIGIGITAIPFSE